MEARRAKRAQGRSGFPGDVPTSRSSIGFTDQPPSVRPECLRAGCSCPATEQMSKPARVTARAAEYTEQSQKGKWYEMPCGDDYDELAQALVASVDTVYGPHLADSPLLLSPNCALCSVGLFDYPVGFLTVDCGLQSGTIRLPHGTYY